MKRFLTPVAPWDVAATETWLEEMARKGYFLYRYRPLFCTFEKGEPADVRYRVEVFFSGISGPSRDAERMEELYREFGWEYVDVLGPCMAIFTARDPDTPEPHSDLSLQAEGWKQVRRKLTWQVLGEAVYLLVMLAVVAASVAMGEFVIVLVTGSGAVFLLMLFVSALWDLPDKMAGRRRAADIVSQLQEGIPLDHHTLYPRKGRPALLPFVLACAALVCLLSFRVILPFFRPALLQPLDTPIPFSRLVLPDLQGDELPTGTDYMNYVRRLDSSLLCWNRWQVVDSRRKDYGEDHGEEMTRLQTEWYDLTIPLFSVPLAEEQFRKAMKLDMDVWWRGEDGTSWEVEYPDLPETDYLAVAVTRDGRFQAAAVASGSRVAVVRFTGEESLKDYIPGIVRMTAG